MFTDTISLLLLCFLHLPELLWWVCSFYILSHSQQWRLHLQTVLKNCILKTGNLFHLLKLPQKGLAIFQFQYMFVELKWIAIVLSPYNHKTRVIRDIALHGFTQGEKCLLQKNSCNRKGKQTVFISRRGMLKQISFSEYEVESQTRHTNYTSKDPSRFLFLFLSFLFVTDKVLRISCFLTNSL